jgi:outer membrane lipoprotein SlyB
MKPVRRRLLGTSLVAALAFAGGARTALAAPEPAASSATAARAAPSAHVGRITGIDPIRTRPKGTGVGAVAGGVAGGLIGNRVIGGTAATAIGAVGGAVAGNNLERNHREGVSGYHVHLRMDNGNSRTVDQTQVGDLHVGDRVRIDRGRLRRL